ncbi:hypothetical protein ABZ960_16890 [Streptomyces pseudovenezuelae]|uniref:hypothetical protein n=1 Tax=Streptomyces pseudovenezuelae TaxID=67350 RepID=UPI0034A54507
MTLVSPSDLVGAVERGCRGTRDPHPLGEPGRSRIVGPAPATALPGDLPAAVLEAAFRLHALVVPRPDPYGVVVTGHFGGRTQHAVLATAVDTVTVPADPSWTGALAEAFPDSGLLFLVCADFGRISGGRTPTAYPDLLTGAGALARALSRAANSLGLDSRIHTGGRRPVTSAVRRLRPGQRHVLTVTASPTDGSST